ncbi:hypothetical protein [Yinghuangia sp. YIM S10712]|uniref:hypothetical protein n=1 Tax=Yinghuangia sp. YIM S10712 TaxID=3436930 RepID=UPI003F530D9D
MTSHQHPDPVSPTLHELLQRGHGRGALRATAEDAGLVFDCVAHDRRVDWQVEQRAVYFARLIRDLGLPVRPLADILHAHDAADVPDDGTRAAGDPYENDDFAVFCLALDILSALGSSGSAEAVRVLRDFVHSGERWIEALEDIAADWPRDLWDDLADVARARAGEIAPGAVFATMSPWREWRSEHPWVAELLEKLDPHDDEEFAAGPADGTLEGPSGSPVTPVSPRTPLSSVAREAEEPESAYTARLRDLWLTLPHSPARAGVLRALLARHAAEQPGWLAEFVHEALWDSEDEVRLLGVRHADFHAPDTRERLAVLADDPIEDEAVRAAARRRLAP